MVSDPGLGSEYAAWSILDTLSSITSNTPKTSGTLGPMSQSRPMRSHLSRRLASVSSALIVAGIAAVASYSHMRHLAVEYGQTEVIADMLPISVDGMLVVATVALGDGRRYRWSAWLAFWIGVVASIIANVLAAEPSAIARCISAWPAIAFLLVVEVITRGGRGQKIEPLPVPIEEPPAEVPEAEPDDTADETSWRPTPATEKVARARARWPQLSQQEIATKTGLSISTVKRQWPFTSPLTDPAPVNGQVPQLTTITT